ncbi:hypothetical protein H0H92_011310, partial [Tricholoma furcatifolium]
RYDPAQAREARILPTFHSRPAEFFAANVRNLCICADVSFAFRRIALLKCTFRHLGLYDYVSNLHSGFAFATASTLSSLVTTKDALSQMMILRIRLPSLSFLGVHGDMMEPLMPSLDWLSELKTVELEFDNPLIDIVWENNAVQVLATTLQLQELWINIQPDRDSFSEVDTAIDADQIPDRVTVYIRNANVHEDFISEWRARIGGRFSYKHSSLGSDDSRPSKKVEYCARSCWDIDEEDDDPFGFEELGEAIVLP